MDPVTHVVSGLLAGQATREAFPAGRLALWFGAVAAWLPDMDNFSSLLGPEAYLRLHRGYTHSLAGGLLLAALLCLPVILTRRDVRPGRLYGLAYGAILLHIFLDCITSYGTQVLLPFSQARLSLPVVFIIDPVYTLSLTAVLLLSLWAGQRRRIFACFGLLWLVLYPITNLGVREAVAQAYATKLGAPPAMIHVEAEAFSPVCWKVIVEDQDSYRLAGVNLLDRQWVEPERRYAQADREQLRRWATDTPFLTTWDWFSQYPALAQDTQLAPTPRRQTIIDLRFVSTNPLASRIMGPVPPFTITTVADGAGGLEELLYHDNSHLRPLKVGH